MKKINIRDLFPSYELDCYIEVPDGDAKAYAASITQAIADVFFRFERSEIAYLRRLFWNKAHYSLDAGDGIECAVLFMQPDPAELYEHKLMVQHLYAAIANLPDKQAKRIYAYFYLNMSKAAIAKAEGVSVQAVTCSIERGLRRLSDLFVKLL